MTRSTAVGRLLRRDQLKLLASFLLPPVCLLLFSGVARGVRVHLLTFRGAAITPQHPVSMPPSGYVLTFDDEFSTLSISDMDGAGTRWYTHTVQCCMSDTSAPATPTTMAGIGAPPGQNPYALLSSSPDGQPRGEHGLRIRLQKANGGWYSGVLATVDRQGRGFAQQYGYFEMKARFPGVPGAWPAFWLLNSAALTRHAPAGEIDVVESYMFAPAYINTTLHDWTPPGRQIAYHLAHVSNLSTGFHTFGLLWTASTMRFFCDGEEIYTVPTPPIMHQPYYPLLDLGLGGGWPTNKTPAQADMEVQYVRVYAPRVEPSEDAVSTASPARNPATN